MHPFQAVADRELVSLARHGVLEPLTWEERDLLKVATHALLRPNWRRSPLFLYRGESKKHLRKQLLPSWATNHPDDVLFSQVFYFGTKARHFWMEDDDALRRRGWLRNLHDDSPTTFSWIFRKIRYVLGSGSARVAEFSVANASFATYFREAANRSDFVDRAERLPPPYRQAARDYYLHILHTVGRSGLYKPSFMVSASIDLDVASEFRDPKGGNLVLYLFVPAPHARHCVSPGLRNQLSPAVRVMGTPLCRLQHSFFPEQQEYGLRGAVFPQLILGVDDCDEGRFVVNPHLLSMSRRELEKLGRFGIRVDQDDFHQAVAGTGFNRYASMDSHDVYCGVPLGFDHRLRPPEYLKVRRGRLI